MKPPLVKQFFHTLLLCNVQNAVDSETCSAPVFSKLGPVITYVVCLALVETLPMAYMDVSLHLSPAFLLLDPRDRQQHHRDISVYWSRFSSLGICKTC